MISVQTHQRIHLLALFSGVIALMLILCIGRVAKIVIIAALLSYILDPVVTALERRGVSRTAAAVLIMLLITLTMATFWYTVVPIAIDQFKSLQQNTGMMPVSKVTAQLESLLRNRFGFLGMEDFSLTTELAKGKAALVSRIPNFLIQDSPALVLGSVMIPFVMFFLLKDIRSFKKYFISLVPNRYFEFTLDLLYKMETQLGNYLRGQFIDNLVYGLLATALLWLLDVPYFIFIGIFAGLANLIPFVGPLAGALAALIAVIFEQGDFVRCGYVLLAFVVLKLVDDLVIQPLAFGRNVDLHPMVVALAIIVGGHLFGILGMLLVIPCLGFLKVVLEEGISTYRRYRFVATDSAARRLD